jgi:hypothetical protein
MRKSKVSIGSVIIRYPCHAPAWTVRASGELAVNEWKQASPLCGAGRTIMYINIFYVSEFL